MAKWVEWKEIEKIRSTYGKSIRDKLVDGRVHAGFKPFGTAKGRFSSSNPNLQNIPKRGELGPRIRGLFWAGLIRGGASLAAGWRLLSTRWTRQARRAHRYDAWRAAGVTRTTAVAPGQAGGGPGVHSSARMA